MFFRKVFFFLGVLILQVESRIIKDESSGQKNNKTENGASKLQLLANEKEQFVNRMAQEVFGQNYNSISKGAKTLIDVEFAFFLKEMKNVGNELFTESKQRILDLIAYLEVEHEQEIEVAALPYREGDSVRLKLRIEYIEKMSEEVFQKKSWQLSTDEWIIVNNDYLIYRAQLNRRKNEEMMKSKENISKLAKFSKETVLNTETTTSNNSAETTTETQDSVTSKSEDNENHSKVKVEEECCDIHVYDEDTSGSGKFNKDLKKCPENAKFTCSVKSSNDRESTTVITLNKVTEVLIGFNGKTIEAELACNFTSNTWYYNSKKGVKLPVKSIGCDLDDSM